MHEHVEIAVNSEIARTPDRLQALRGMPYEEYLQTPEWRRTRDGALRRAGFRCELEHCRAKGSLHVHHRTYERLGEEVPEDLTVLCSVCHTEWHTGLLPGQPHDPLAVYIALAYDVLKDGARESFADFLEVLKTRCAKLRLPYRDHQVDQAVARLVKVLKAPFPIVPVIPDKLLPATEPSISHSEAVNMLAKLGIHTVRTMSAVRQLSPQEILERQWRADQRRAYQLVQQAILDTAQRVAALEDQIVDTPREIETTEGR